MSRFMSRSVSIALRVSLPLLFATAACAPLRQSGSGGLFHRQPERELAPAEQVSHVLSRLTFGARPGDAQRMAAMGVDKWIREQLLPESVPDSALAPALAPLAAWTQSPASLLEVAPPRVITAAVPAVPNTDTAKRVIAGAGAVMPVVPARTVTVRQLVPINDQFFAGKIIRAQLSERQLLEVVADFWENHFSVFSGKLSSREALVALDREVIRPRALGRFRDLLGAVAHSPAMLFYLDNQNSRKRAINENYARELLELHTLGVDGGYSQQDVIEVARALTGWTLTNATPPGGTRAYVFRPAMHDSASKQVLGHTLAPGRGEEDGEQVFDIIARHPSTARFIARKLAVRFVSDTPPKALVERAAATFTRTDGNIAEVVRSIVTSPEFFSRAALRAKIKTPFELVVSARRALNMPVDTSPRVVRQIGQLGQPMFGSQSPDGWPDDASAWVNTGTIRQRIRFGTELLNGPQGPTLLLHWRTASELSALDVHHQVDGVVQHLLGGIVSPSTREVMLASSGLPLVRLREMMALALGSPEFQRR